MTDDTVYDCLINFLGQKQIIVEPQFQYGKEFDYNKLKEEEVRKQLELIFQFHKSMIGLNSYMIKRLENKTGKTVEEYKVNIRKLKRQIKTIELKSPNNEYEELLLKQGNHYIVRAQRCIDEINKCNYINLITRSMNNNEVCLGNTDFENLGYLNKIVIKQIENCCFNMVEMDCWYLLSRLKRKGKEFNWHSLVNYFCKEHSIGLDSEGFILALMSYPYEFMKCCTRYRENKKTWNAEKYKRNLEKAIIKDGESLV